LAGESRVVRIYNGLDLDRFSRNVGARQDPPLVLAVGRLVEKKGFADLVRACGLLRRDGVRFRCRIVGKGELEGELRSLVQKLGLEDIVELGGPAGREELLALYPRASALVAPCLVGSDGNRDGLPTVLAEAMALGVPVVSTDVTGIPELVEDGRTGLLVPQHRPEALAASIQRILDDRAGAEQFVRAARKRVEREFDLRANVAELRSLFEEVTAA
jgi:glycosyltransferase involved in cell wall biosynthesis